MDLSCEGHVLLVGDGDFSFTLSLMKKGLLKGSQVTTSNLETLESIQQHQLAADNMKALTEMGVRVLLEINACELHTHPIINQVCYQRVIFNFPLADRHNVKKNRALLADFFSSCLQILSDVGQVMVTLCKGQGGTPADQPMRSWHDSWQIHAMATNAGFILRDVIPFDATRYPEYHSVGFRFQDKSFNTDNALTHIFEKADIVVSDGVQARGIVESGGNSYTCSHYVTEKINRNLLQDVNNPLCLLRKRLEIIFSLELGARIIPENQDLCILPGHVSRISTDSINFDSKEYIGTVTSSTFDTECNDTHERSDDALQSDKERKNKANQMMMMKTAKVASLVHGVDRSAGENNWETLNKDNTSQQFKDKKFQISKLIPEDSESVFILIKRNNTSTSDSCRNNSVENGDNTSDPTRDVENMDSSVTDELTAVENVQTLASSNRSEYINQESCAAVNSGTRDSHNFQDITSFPDSNANALTDDEHIHSCTDRVFHCRTSLIENLSDLYADTCENDSSRICQKDVSERLPSSEMPACSRSSEQVHSHSEVCQITSPTPSDQDGPDLAEMCGAVLSEVASINGQCFVTSGKCFLPGPIVPEVLAVRHEMMFVQRICNSCTSVTQENTQALKSPHSSNTSRKASVASESNFNEDAALLVSGTGNLKEPGHTAPLQNYVSASEHLLSCLNNLDLFSHTSLSVQDVGSNRELIKIHGFESVTNIKLIYMESEPYSEGALGQDTQNQGSNVVAGVMFKAARGSDQMLVTVLELDDIACRVCGIDDPRLLWSQSKRFTDQFHASSFPQQFSPFSLYPMMFAHDLSFWQKDSESEFDIDEMYNIIRYVAGDLVSRVSLIDLYSDPNTGQRSRCYRLGFMSHDLALPYLVSWKLQSLIRMEIAQKLGVTLR